MTTQPQETGRVVGYRAETDSGRLDVDTVEEMQEILRRQDTPGDALYEVGMEFFTLISGPDGIEAKSGFSESIPPGTVLYRQKCAVCQCHLWCFGSDPGSKAYCSDHTPGDWD